MEDKGKMDELIEQMKLMNERLGNVEKMLEESIYHQHRTDFTSEYVARQQGYTGFINEDIALAPKPPSRLFGNHFIKINDARIMQRSGSRYENYKPGTPYTCGDNMGKVRGSIDISVGNIHDRKGNIQYLKSLSEDDTNMKDFVWLSGEINLGEEVERRPFTAVEVIHLVPVLTETNDLGGKIRQAKAETEEKEKQERLKREELEKQRKYEEDLRNRTERGEKFEFTPEQLHEIVNNTPEGQRLLQEKKRRLEEEAGGAPREDSRVASLAERVDEDLVVFEASSVGEENT